jgi:hypothetical protein
MLGGDEADGTQYQLSDLDSQIDAALSALYDFERKRSFNYGQNGGGAGGNSSSSPSVARWLGDINKYFPQSVVQVMQGDALKHPELQQKLMLEPEILEKLRPTCI